MSEIRLVKSVFVMWRLLRCQIVSTGYGVPCENGLFFPLKLEKMAANLTVSSG